MFYFNEKHYNFWDIYNCIHKFYPIGSIAEGMDSFYNSYPGIIEQKKIIAENIYDNNVFSHNWGRFCEDISRTTNQNLIGTTYGMKPSYSAKIELKRTDYADITRTKELHFFVSLLGPFYTIIGVDKNECIYENKFYQSNNFLTVSPENEYKDLFIYMSKRIEEQFTSYRFVPFFICRQIIDGLSWEFKEKSCRVFQAIFDNSIDLEVNIIGNESYQSWQWQINQKGTTDRWATI